MDMEDVLLLEKNICAVYTVHVLYIQYMYCTYSTCTVHTVHVLCIQRIYSSPTTRHLPCPYSISHLPRAYTMSIQHIPCLKSIHIESIDIRPGPDPKNWRFSLFPRIEGWPLGCQILSSLIVFKGFRAYENIDFVKFQKFDYFIPK